MSVEIKVPSVGESIVEGTIARWLKKDGATVRADEPVFELETEKATTEVAAPAGGQLVIRVQEGETVAIGSVVGQINTDGAVTEAHAAEAAAAKPAPKEETPAAKPAAPPATTPAPAETLAPRPATEKGTDARENDKPAIAEPEKPPPTATRLPGDRRETRQRMSAIRARIAERLVAAQQTAAILTTFNECDMSGVIDIRSRYKEAFHKKHGVRLGFMSFFVKAAAQALRAVPVVNAFIDGNDVVFHDYCDIGVAVSTEKGLMVPVIRNCESLGFAEIEKQIEELAQRARAGKIGVQDLQGGTFTITNGGVFGSLLSTPLLNPPQSAILGMHTIQKRPVAVNDEVIIRPMMYLALSYDHRLIDGRDAVQFLLGIKDRIERPERMMLGI